MTLHPNDVAANDRRRAHISAILTEIERLERTLAGRIPPWDKELMHDAMQSISNMERAANKMLLDQEWRPR